MKKTDNAGVVQLGIAFFQHFGDGIERVTMAHGVGKFNFIHPQFGDGVLASVLGSQAEDD